MLGRVRQRTISASEWREVAAGLTGPSGLTQNSSSFTRRDVIEAFCERLPAGAAVARWKLERAADELLASQEVVALATGREAELFGTTFVRRDGRVLPVEPSELRYTTRELLGVERGLIDRAGSGPVASAGVAHEAAVERALADRPTLSAEQTTMVRALTESGDRVAVVTGRAGTGKTFALAACNAAWDATGTCVIGAAVARRAAGELEDQAGIPSTSVSALLAGLKRGRPLPRGTVLVVDEAGMAGTRQLSAMLDAVEAVDGKLVLIGDSRQLPSIDAGGAFHALARQLPAIELTENRRQVHAWEREVVDLLRQGRGHEAVQHYRNHDRLHVADTTHQARAQLVSDWWGAAAKGDALMIALRRADVSDLNQSAHDLMRAAGRLGAEELELAGGRFAVGDRILVRHNDLRLGIANGDRGVVTSVDNRAQVLEVELAGTRVTLDRRYLCATTGGGDPTITYGYAVTGHSAQGATVDRAFVLADSSLSQEWGYTALTRGRQANHLYVPATEDSARQEFAPTDAPTADPVERLGTALSTSRAQVLALEQHVPQAPARAIVRALDTLNDRTAARTTDNAISL
jgi:ATP-dependent exoDNAse (exonuclease V) alpha subunit